MVVPTTQEITDLIIAQLEGSLEQTIPLLPKAFNRVLAKVLAGVFVMLYRYAGFIFLQLFIEHATMKATTVNGKEIRPLVELGRRTGVTDPAEATRAAFVAIVAVTNQTGTLGARKLLVNSSTNVIYETVTEVPLNGPLIAVPIRAVSDQNGGDGSGTIGNMEPGDTINFSSPIPNVQTAVLIQSQTVVGADAETEDSYRARVRDRSQARPQGGAYADYRTWGEEAAGIANIYPYTGVNPGEVDVFVEVDVGVDPDGIADTAHLNAVRDSINLNGADGKATRRPANAAVNTLSIGRSAWEVEIANLEVDGDPQPVKDELQAGLDEFLRSREPFIVGLSVLPRQDRLTTAAIAGIVDTIVSAAGGTVSGVLLQRSGVPVLSYTLSHGEKAKLANSEPHYV